MTGERDDLDALRRALEAFGQEHAHALVEDARAEALQRARSILATEMTRALLDGAEPHLAPGTRAARRPAAGPRSPDARRTAPAERPAAAPRPEEPPAPSPSASALGGTATYVYGVAAGDPEDLAAALETVSGVGDGEPPFLIPDGDLHAIASDVPLAEFDEERLRENLNDVEWLEHAARGHELVLEVAREATTVVPLRLCTIYRGEDQVRAMLDRERPVFRDALQRLEGKTEWGVKLIAAPGSLEQALAEEEPEDPGEVSPGVAYMKSRSREARERDAIDELANEWAAEAHDRLAEAAVEALLNPLQNPEVSGHVGEMLLNGVYLVADAGIDGFRDVVEALASSFEDRDVSVEMTGPWPPYNFVKGSIEAAR